jgi:hypothetical protein
MLAARQRSMGFIQPCWPLRPFCRCFVSGIGVCWLSELWHCAVANACCVPWAAAVVTSELCYCFEFTTVLEVQRFVSVAHGSFFVLYPRGNISGGVLLLCPETSFHVFLLILFFVKSHMSTQEETEGCIGPVTASWAGKDSQGNVQPCMEEPTRCDAARPALAPGSAGSVWCSARSK